MSRRGLDAPDPPRFVALVVELDPAHTCRWVPTADLGRDRFSEADAEVSKKRAAETVNLMGDVEFPETYRSEPCD